MIVLSGELTLSYSIRAPAGSTSLSSPPCRIRMGRVILSASAETRCMALSISAARRAVVFPE